MAEEPIESPLVEVAEDDEMLLRLRLHPAALRAMRRWLFDRLTSAGVEVDRAEEVMLAATEAASNAIEHAQAPSSSHVEVHLTLDPLVHVQVRDTGAWKEPDPVTQRGRGTRIMSALAALTVDRTPEGTVVDLTFPFGAARPLAGFAVEQLDGIAVVRVSGELDLSNVGDLVGAIESAGAGRIAVDLTEVRYLDSAPIRHLVRLHNDGVQLELVCPRAATPARIVRTTGLADVIPLRESLDRA